MHLFSIVHLRLKKKTPQKTKTAEVQELNNTQYYFPLG